MLVPLGCTKVSQMGADGGRTRAFISHPEAGRPRGRCWPIGCLGVSPWLVHGPFALSSPGRETTLVSPLLTRAPFPPWGPHPLDLISPQPPPMGPPANPPTRGGGWGFVIWTGGGVRSTAPSGLVATEAPEAATRVRAVSAMETPRLTQSSACTSSMVVLFQHTK